MGRIDELESALRPFDVLLRPLANRPVDITRSDWVTRAVTADPLHEAGIARDTAQALVDRITDLYALGSAEERDAIRGLFERYRAFAWAVQWLQAPMTRETFRQQLVLFSILDQGQDSRDAILSLQALCAGGMRAGVDIVPVLEEVADLSSTRNKFGMGSTQALLIASMRSA